MTWQAWVTLVSLLAALAGVAFGRMPAHAAFAGAVALVILSGAVDATVAVQGFASQAMLTVGLLYVVAAALRRTGAMSMLTRPLLRDQSSEATAQLRLMAPVALLSAVLNNTPVVAMLIPEVRAWARRNGRAASRFLIPLSYAAILGGLGTIIGTSTNLVVNDLVDAAGLRPFGFIEIGRLGFPLMAIGIVVVVVLARWLLPEREDVDHAFNDPRQFTTELEVEADGPLVGMRLADIHLADGYRLSPVEIQRGSHVIPAPRGDHVLEDNDRLVVAGPAAAMLAIHSQAGLRPSENSFSSRMHAGDGRIVEVVIAERCPLVGQRVGDGSFRRIYNAAVIAVARHGERVAAAGLAGWSLRAGDTVLLETGADFMTRHRFSGDFHVVTDHEKLHEDQSRWRSWVGIVLLVGMVAAAASGWLSMFEAALAIAGVLMLSGCVNRQDALQAIDMRVLLTIACALGLGAALVETGAASVLSGSLLSIGGAEPHLQLAMIYLATMVATELVTNTAAASLMVPIALATAQRLEVAHEPFVATVMVAASASFMTPLGYQTNLMVYGPGGYRFSDFMRIGLPLTLAVMGATVWLAPIIWPW